MSRALGVSGTPDHPKLVEVVHRVADAVRKGSPLAVSFEGLPVRSARQLYAVRAGEPAKGGEVDGGRGGSGAATVHARGVPPDGRGRHLKPTEYWLVDCTAESVEVFRSPGAEGYRDVSRVGGEGTVTVEAFPDVTLRIAEIFA